MNAHHTVLTDSLERELLQAELSHQMDSPLNGLFDAIAQHLAQLVAKIANVFHHASHQAAAKTA